MSIGELGFVILAAVFWGLSGGLSGFLMDKGWDPLIIAFYRGFVGLICISIWYAIKPTRWNKKLILWSILAGVGVAGNFIFYNISISEASVAVAATLMYTAPIFVLLISFIFKLEKATLFKGMAILSVLAGVILMTEVYSIDSDSVTLLGIAAGLGAGVSYALFLFGFKYASRHGKPQNVLTAAFLTFSLLMLFVIDYSETISVLSSPDIAWVVLLGLFGAGLSFYLYVKGLERTSPSTASVAAMVEPVTASLFGVVVLSEILTGIQLIGMGIILATVTFLSFKKE